MNTNLEELTDSTTPLLDCLKPLSQVARTIALANVVCLPREGNYQTANSQIGHKKVLDMSTESFCNSTRVLCIKILHCLCGAGDNRLNHTLIVSLLAQFLNSKHGVVVLNTGTGIGNDCRLPSSHQQIKSQILYSAFLLHKLL